MTTTINQKQEIVQSLNCLDAVQSEKVLDYVKTLLRGKVGEARDLSLTRKEIKTINKALGGVRLWI